MPQDDATQAGGQSAQPILPGASSLVRTGGGAAVNEAGMSTAVVPSANPAAQPVVLGGSGALPTTATTPAAGTNALPTSTQPVTDPFATPAWLQPVPTTPAPQAVPLVQSQPMPVTQAVSSPASVTTPTATIPDLPAVITPTTPIQGISTSGIPAVSSSAVGDVGVPTTSVPAANPTVNASAVQPSVGPAPSVTPPPTDTNSSSTTDPLTGGPIDWDSIAKRFEEQSAAVPAPSTTETIVPLATVTSTTDLAASDVTEPLPTTVETPEASTPTADAMQTPAVVPDVLDSSLTTTFDPSFGLPDVGSEQSELSGPQSGDTVENKKKGRGLKSLLSGLGAALSSLPWNKKRKEQGESDQQQISSAPEINANMTSDLAVLPPLSVPGTDTVPDLGTTPVTPAELAAATALPEKPLVPLAGPETSTLPELSGLDAVPKDLFDPNNFVMPTPIAGLSTQTIGGEAASGSDLPAKKGPNLVKIFIVLLIVVLLGTVVLFLITQISSSPGGTSNPPANPLPTTPGDPGNETPGVEVPQEPGSKVDTKSIYIYLVAFGADSSTNIPDGSVQIGADYLVRVLTAENVHAEEPVSIALAKLLSLNTEKYADTKYSNLLYKSKLKALVKEGENGKLLIDLQGTFEVAKDSDFVYAKQQVERTIENYTFNYTLSLNGSEESWTNLGEGN